MEINSVTGEIVDSAIKIHTRLGPGLFESVYEEVLGYELRKKGFTVHRQVAVPVVYDEIIMETSFRIDLLVSNLVIIEVKSVESINPVHKKQLLSYLRLKNLQIGLLINFNELFLRNGISRIFNNHFIE